MPYQPGVGGISDTIAAISTPRGEAAICMVRISGALALTIATHIFKRKDGKNVAEMMPRKIYLGSIFDPKNGEDIDEAQVVFFRHPKTYTGEDMVEMYGHGGIFVSEKILDAALKKGARFAERGEFTLRAFLNGKIDLTQAESVLDIIKAKNDEFLRISLKNQKGELQNRIINIKSKLISILAEIEVEIEYPDEDFNFVSEEKIKEIAIEVRDELKAILSTYKMGKFLREGFKIALLGPPNVGKSSIMNKLLTKNRVIVTPLPGTTRDLVGDWLTVGGMDVLLMDTAGLTETEDLIEKEGIKKTEEFAEQADLLFFVFDGTRPISPKIRKVAEVIAIKKNVKPVINKQDLPWEISPLDVEKIFGDKYVPTSALTGEGIEILKKIINDEVKKRLDIETETVISNYRHKECIEKAIEALSEAIENAQPPVDIMSINIRRATECLGNILGENVGDAVLEEIFSNFCVGK